MKYRYFINVTVENTRGFRFHFSGIRNITYEIEDNDHLNHFVKQCMGKENIGEIRAYDVVNFHLVSVVEDDVFDVFFIQGKCFSKASQLYIGNVSYVLKISKNKPFDIENIVEELTHRAATEYVAKCEVKLSLITKLREERTYD